MAKWYREALRESTKDGEISVHYLSIGDCIAIENALEVQSPYSDRLKHLRELFDSACDIAIIVNSKP